LLSPQHGPILPSQLDSKSPPPVKSLSVRRSTSIKSWRPQQMPCSFTGPENLSLSSDSYTPDLGSRPPIGFGLNRSPSCELIVAEKANSNLKNESNVSVEYFPRWSQTELSQQYIAFMTSSFPIHASRNTPRDRDLNDQDTASIRSQHSAEEIQDHQQTVDVNHFMKIVAQSFNQFDATIARSAARFESELRGLREEINEARPPNPRYQKPKNRKKTVRDPRLDHPSRTNFLVPFFQRCLIDCTLIG
jgi:hypothetical protein